MRHGGLLRLPARARRTFASAVLPDATASTGPLGAYAQLLRLGRLREDASQSSAVHELQRFAEAVPDSGATTAGVYLWGSVGSGKSMVMDLFAGSCAEDCTRLHFHEFMLDVHQRLHALQAARPRRIIFTKLGLPVYKYDDEPSTTEAAPETSLNDSSSSSSSSSSSAGAAANGVAATATAAAGASARAKTSEPMEHVIDALASRSRVLCLDEMQVADVADAMILRQLFEGVCSPPPSRATTFFSTAVWRF